MEGGDHLKDVKQLAQVGGRDLGGQLLPGPGVPHHLLSPKHTPWAMVKT